MDVERRLIIMRRIAGAVGTAVLQILKWMLKIVLGALKLFLGLVRLVLLLFCLIARVFLSFVRSAGFKKTLQRGVFRSVCERKGCMQGTEYG